MYKNEFLGRMVLSPVGQTGNGGTTRRWYRRLTIPCLVGFSGLMAWIGFTNPLLLSIFNSSVNVAKKSRLYNFCIESISFFLFLYLIFFFYKSCFQFNSYQVTSNAFDQFYIENSPDHLSFTILFWMHFTLTIFIHVFFYIFFI